MAREYFQVATSPSARFPFMISDIPIEIFGLAVRLMDEGRVDGMSSFAVTPQDDGKWSLWMDKKSKEYLVD